MDTYTAIKYVHVVLAIVAVGFNASYGIWLGRAARDPAHLGHVLRGIKLLDDRFADPAYGLLLVTGLAMVFVSGLPLTTLWIAAALGLYAVLLVGGLAVYTPTLRKQIALLDSAGPASALPVDGAPRPARRYRASDRGAGDRLPHGGEAVALGSDGGAMNARRSLRCTGAVPVAKTTSRRSRPRWRPRRW